MAGALFLVATPIGNLGDLSARAVDTLRAELVAEREGWSAARRELAARQGDLDTLRHAHEELARDRARLEERYHALNGELAAVRAELGQWKEDHGRLTAEAQRLYDEEGKLRQAVDEQTAHLGRTYAEIERLNGLIRTMQSTRAWRAHQWWQRRTS